MKALITGGAGFIGSHLSQLLLEQNYQVVAIDDLSQGSERNITHLADNPGFQFVLETILNESVVDRLVSECDIIFHLAAVVGVELIIKDPTHTIETNVFGTSTVLRIANRYRRKILLTSTSEVYGKSTSVPFNEESDSVIGASSHNRWSYATSKALDDFLALAYHHQQRLPVIICRLFNTIGPRQTGRYGMVVPRLVSQALRNQPLTVYGDGNQTRCFTDVNDVCNAIYGLSIHSEAPGRVYNIGNTEEVSILELANKIIKLTNSKSRISIIPYDKAYQPGFEDMVRRVPDITRVKDLIGFSPCFTLEESLVKIIKWMQSSDNIDCF